jgi:hypothetical protein
MPDPLQALLGTDALPSVTFPPNSRYAGTDVLAYVRTPAPGADPVPIAFLRRRLVPSADRFAALYTYQTVEGDRRDLVAAAQLADPYLWWRLADANGVIDPADLATVPGTALRITLPVDVPGGAGA